MATYHSPTEDRELEAIQKAFPDHEIVNPRSYDENKEKATRQMEYCKDLVTTCDKLVFTRMFGHVTSGVGIEIEHALSLGKPVFELVNGKVKQVRKVPKYLTREETNDLSRQWRKRNVSYWPYRPSSYQRHTVCQ